MPKGNHLPVHVCQEILLKFDAYRREGDSITLACTRIGEETRLAPKTVHAVLQRLRPTTDVAKMYLKAKAYKLAKRLVNKASPAEIIDVLERPGMGVLEPTKKIESGGGGFFLSVQTDTCGAVKVGVATGQAAPSLPAVTPDFNPFLGLSQETFDEASPAGNEPQRIAHQQSPRKALAAGQAESKHRTLEEARAKLQAARAAAQALPAPH